MRFINGEIVNKGIWECLKQCGSLNNLARDLQSKGVGFSTVRQSLNRARVRGKIKDACIEKYGVNSEYFKATVTLFMAEEE